MGQCFDPNCRHRSERETCTFFRMPKSPGLRKKWLRALNRRDGKEPGSSAFLCSCHFPGESKRKTPVFKGRSPVLLPRSPRPSPRRSPKKSNTRRKLDLAHAEGIAPLLDVIPEEGECSPLAPADTLEPAESRSACDLRKSMDSMTIKCLDLEKMYETLKDEKRVLEVSHQSLKEKCSVLEGKCASAERKNEMLDERCQLLDLKCNELEQRVTQKQTEKENLAADIQTLRADVKLMVQLSKTLKREKAILSDALIAAKQRLNFVNFCTDDNIAHFTGLPNVNTFYWLLSMVPEKLTYYYKSNVLILSRQDQLFLTLMKLRRNPSHTMLGAWFKVSNFVVSNVIQTWVNAMQTILVKGLMMEVPSLRKVKKSMPDAFSKYPNCRMIIDCTEVTVQVPGSMDKQNQAYSSYKSRTTFKGLKGISPNGTVVFVSPLYPGSTSDKKIVEKCGVLDVFAAGDAVMADKGFLIKDLLPPGVTLNIPPFKQTAQFTSGQISETLEIARARIHVERAIRRTKLYHILDLIPASMNQFATSVFQVCSALTNFMPPLIQEVADLMREH